MRIILSGNVIYILRDDLMSLWQGASIKLGGALNTAIWAVFKPLNDAPKVEIQ